MTTTPAPELDQARIERLTDRILEAFAATHAEGVTPHEAAEAYIRVGAVVVLKIALPGRYDEVLARLVRGLAVAVADLHADETGGPPPGHA